MSPTTRPRLASNESDPTLIAPVARLPADRSHALHESAQRAHLIGIAGSGMQSLARVLLERGWTLTGSDLATSEAGWLAEAGVGLLTGHAAAHLPPESQLVIYSDAVGRDNPERQQAARRSLPELSYPQMLGRLVQGHDGLAVAGTHGKSTTTAMAAQILVEAGLDPTVLGGGAPLGSDTMGRAGRGDLVLVEACEYRANFRHIEPRAAVILGIELDHFDAFSTQAEVEAAFAAFVGKVPPDGLVLAHRDCQATARAVRGARCRVATFGLRRDADWWAARVAEKSGRYRFRLFHGDCSVCDVRLRVAGRHNMLNALAAAALACQRGASARAVERGLAEFAGLKRRLQWVGRRGGVDFWDDYAHHPTEVIAALRTMGQLAPGRRIWVVFQPHQVLRTRHLLDELAASLQNADRVAVAEIFAAREPVWQEGGVTAADLARRVRALGACVLQPHRLEEIWTHLHRDLLPGDVVITLGAGDIRKVWDGLAKRFRKIPAAR